MDTQISSTRRLSVARWIPVLGGALAVVVGVAMVRVGPRWTLLIAGLLLAGPSLAALPIRTARSLRRAAQDQPATDGPAIVAARACYYLGLGTIGALSVRLGGFTVSDGCFLAALALTIVAAATDRRHLPFPPRLPQLILLGAALWTAGSLLSSFDSAQPFQALLVAARLLYLTVVWFWLGARLLTSPRHLRVAVICWVASAAVGGLAAIGQYRWHLALPGVPAGLVFPGGRMTGTTQHSNDLGGLTGIALAPALLLATQPLRRRWLRPLCVALLVLVSAWLLLSGSLGGLAAAACSITVWLALARSRRVATATVTIGLLVVAWMFVGQLDTQTQFSRFGRATAMDGSSEATLQARIVTNQAALDLINQNPLVGVGVEQGHAGALLGMEVHNLLLNAWVQSGLFGLVGILLVLSTGLGMAWQNLTAAAEERPTAAALAASLVGFLVMAMSHPALYQRHGWVAVAMSVAANAQARRNAQLSTQPPVSIPG
jgi:O-antigen ligase